jgi:hypothetical protein
MMLVTVFVAPNAAAMMIAAMAMNAWTTHVIQSAIVIRRTLAMILVPVFVPTSAAATVIAAMRTIYAWTTYAAFVIRVRNAPPVNVRTIIAATLHVIPMEMDIVVRTILATMILLLEGRDDLGHHNECVLNQRWLMIYEIHIGVNIVIRS